MVGIAFALLFAMLVAVASIFARRGLEDGSFYALLLVSLAVASPAFLLVTALTTGFADAPLRGVVYAAAGGVSGSVLGRSLYFLGIEYLGPGKSLSLNATSPLYAAVLAWIVLDETITSPVVVGTVAIVLGIVVLSKDVRTETERTDHSILVALYPLGSAVFASVSVTFRKLALDVGVAPIEAGAVNMVVGLAVVAPFVATRRREAVVGVDPGALRNFVAASLLITVGFAFYFVGLRTTDASVFFPLIQTQPLFAVALSAVFLRRLEVVTRWTALGAVTIVLGAVLVVVG